MSKGSIIMTPLSQTDDESGRSSEKAITTDGEGEDDNTIESRVGRKGSWGSMSALLDSSYAFVIKETAPEDSGDLRRRKGAPS